MSNPLRVAVLVGSLRKASVNRRMAHALAKAAPQSLKLEIVEIGDLPLYNEDLEKGATPAAWTAFRDRVKGADAVLFVTPEYNYSIPGVLKNAIDWCARPYGDSAWKGKPVAVMGASVGILGTARAQYHLRQTFIYLDMHPLNLPEVMIGSARDRFNEAGELTDETSRKLLRQLLEGLVAWTRRLGAAT